MRVLSVSKVLCGELERQALTEGCKSECQQPAPKLAGRIEDLGDGTARVKLTLGLAALIDAADVALVAVHNWHTVANYAYSERAGMSMHRLITGAPKGMVVDHLNWDTLDNRRVNLRVCTQRENMNNRNPAKLGCVHLMKGATRRRPWRATFARKHVGYFATEQEAREAIQRRREAAAATPTPRRTGAA